MSSFADLFYFLQIFSNSYPKLRKFEFNYNLSSHSDLSVIKIHSVKFKFMIKRFYVSSYLKKKTLLYFETDKIFRVLTKQ